MGQLNLEAISRPRHTKGKKIIRNSKHRLTTGKSCLTSLSFCNETADLADKERAVDIACLDVHKAFNTVPM